MCYLFKDNQLCLLIFFGYSYSISRTLGFFLLFFCSPKCFVTAFCLFVLSTIEVVHLLPMSTSNSVQRSGCNSVPWLHGSDRTYVMPQGIKFRDYYLILELALLCLLNWCLGMHFLIEKFNWDKVSVGSTTTSGCVPPERCKLHVVCLVWWSYMLCPTLSIVHIYVQACTCSNAKTAEFLYAQNSYYCDLAQQYLLAELY